MPKFIFTRDYSNLTYSKINEYIDRSEILNSIFWSNDSDFIAEALQIELNAIYNALAPGKAQQFKTNYIPYYNNEIRDEINRCNEILTKAIKTNNTENWRVFRNTRAVLNKNINSKKSEYLKSKLTEKNNNRKVLK